MSERPFSCAILSGVCFLEIFKYKVSTEVITEKWIDEVFAEME
jgi:hypothetical protein